LIVRPRLLIADEPTASVDEALALRLIILFREMNRLGTTVLIATHNEQLTDRYPYPRLRIQAGCVIENESATNVPGAPLTVAETSAHPQKAAAT
jgi:cell division transport system ATP-binding protein